jgi:hypothetical protein
MIIEARNLKLHNIGQLILVVSGESTLMGKLERVKGPRKEDGAQKMISLRISGETVSVEPSSSVRIRRSPELHELWLASQAMEDIADGVEV